MVNVATCAAVTANDNNALGNLVPPSLTEDKDTYASTLVAFEGACVGAFADSAKPHINKDNIQSAAGKEGGGVSSAPWGTRNVAAPVDSRCCQFPLLLP